MLKSGKNKPFPGRWKQECAIHQYTCNLHPIQEGIHLDHNELIEACRRGDQLAQRQFYDQFSRWVLGVCFRYLSVRDEAEDAMIRAMYKALTHLDTLREISIVKPWLRRIAVNECLMILRGKKLLFTESETIPDIKSTNPDAVDLLEERDLLSLLNTLPTGYRTIFNLYVLEGYTHKEIGELLGISLHTSKSQLIQARKRMAAKLGVNQSISGHETT